MSRIIVQLGSAVAPDGKPFLSISLEEPSEFGSSALPFPCTADDAEFAALRATPLADGSIQVAGGRLYQALSGHPEIGKHMQAALLTAADGRYPVFVEIATPAGAEALPWEALCSPAGDFLGLDQRWALARMVDPPLQGAGLHTLAPPLRIAAVLSCLGIPAAGELEALRSAVRAAGQGHATLLVVASEEALVVDLLAEMQAGTAPEVERVEVIPEDVAALQEMLAGFAPHVLHFFCHGSLAGSPHIAMARKSDWEAAAPTKGLLAEARDFRGFTRATDDVPWLVVLNCCEGAGVAADPGSQSLALALALEGVAPAVVGMREPVVSDTANALSEAIYGKLLADVADRIGAAGEAAQPVDWARLVAAARDRLAQAHDGMVFSQAAASTKEWTLPVVYVRPDDFNLQVVPAAPPPAPPMPPPAESPPAEPPPAPVGAPGGVFPAPYAPPIPETPAPIGAPPAPVPPPAPEPAPVPPPGDAVTSPRAARLEIEALQALLAALPPDQALALKEEAAARIAQLTELLRVDRPPPAAVVAPVP